MAGLGRRAFLSVPWLGLLQQTPSPPKPARRRSTKRGGSRPSEAVPATLEPGEAFDYRPMAMDPVKWDAAGVGTWMVPWPGRRVALLTNSPRFDGAVMARFVATLDAGWDLYEQFLGQTPALFHHVGGLATIAAVPGDLTCGGGCGYLGRTGIEVQYFYADDYPLAGKEPNAFKNYYFYEMGRNFFLFMKQHSCFRTGFAVFMRHVCMERLKRDDAPGDRGAADWLRGLEAQIADTDLTFLKAFTDRGGLAEKDVRHDRLKANQTDIYASAMMTLRREAGGDAWLRRFYQALAACPEIPGDTPEGALRQGLAWYVSASCAAGRDLGHLFVDRWRLPVAAETRQALAQLDWGSVHPAFILGALPIGFQG